MHEWLKFLDAVKVYFKAISTLKDFADEMTTNESGPPQHAAKKHGGRLTTRANEIRKYFEQCSDANSKITGSPENAATPVLMLVEESHLTLWTIVADLKTVSRHANDVAEIKRIGGRLAALALRLDRNA